MYGGPNLDKPVMRAADVVSTVDLNAVDVEKRGPNGRDLGNERLIVNSDQSGVRQLAKGLTLRTLAVLIVALAALIPTVGDFGMTWDEPAYRYSQVMSAQWWEQLGRARTSNDLRKLLDPLTLLYYWPYGRFGVNFHPPLAGQLNLATYAIFGHWMKDIPARRMATVIEFALTIVIGFHFLARRYGGWVGVVTGWLAAGDATTLWAGPPDRHGYARAFVVGGHRAGVLERAQ